MDLTTHIRAYAAKNALEFGKADAGRILPKLFQHGLEKKDIGSIMPTIKQIVDDINKLPKDEIEEIAGELGDFVKEREEKEKKLPELPNAIDGKVFTRMAPEPSKYLHVGHALGFIINYVYSQRHGGKCFLRFDDANPEKVNQAYIEAITEDIEDYLEIKHNGVRFVSDDMMLIYEYAEKLIDKDKSYVCFCDRDKMQELRHSGTECECRNKDKKETLDLWSAFIAGKYKEGSATLRFKGDMQNLNHVLRDPVLFRGVNHKHYKHGTKYKVWPMYDFYTPIEDSLMGLSHVLRSNEFDQRVPLHDEIRDLLGLKKQTIVQYGRFNVIDATTKGREIRDGIEAGEYIGWDDPRLVTLKALRRRGIRKEVFYHMVEQLGLAKKEANIDFDAVAAISRKIIDSETKRYYFVPNPKKFTIENDVKETMVPIHPDKEERRKINVGNEIFISVDDLKGNYGKEVRLLHLFNVKLPHRGDEAEVSGFDVKPMPKIQWVSEGVKVKVFMDNAEWIEGVGEKELMNLKEGEVVQFERFGFVKLDKKDKNSLEFWFTHR